MHTTKTATHAASTPTAHEPDAPKAERRLRAPSVTTPLIAAAIQDVTSPAPSVSATPTVSTKGTACATATPTVAQSSSTTIGAVPVVTSATTQTSPVEAPPAPNVVGLPPAVTMPTRPAGFVAPSPRVYQGFHPSSSEVEAASTAVVELTGFANYGSVFGPLAPTAAAVANALNLAVQWRNMRDSTESWDAYVRAEDGLAWKNALTLADELKPLFLIAVSKNSALAQQYPGLAQLFGAPKQVAKQGLATKKKNAKTSAAKAAAAAPAAAAGAAVQAAPEVASAASPASPKSVTVNA
jgi:hypothetical protein